MMKVGILVGRESTFPQAFIDRVNQKQVDGITAEMIRIGGTRTDEPVPYHVIVDRISHEVPYYRSYLKKAAAAGTIVINNPFWWSADDKFFECYLAANLGVAIPRTVVLPTSQYDADIIDESLRNLVRPVPLEEHLAYVGLPAVLKPAVGGGNKNITMINSAQELNEAYERSGSMLMVLQECIEYENYVRCFCLGRKHVLVARYNHRLPRADRYLDGMDGISDDLQDRIRRDVLTLCRALGYDMNTVEMAIRDGIPYAIDFLNPAPDFDRPSIQPDRFEWVVETMANLVIEMAGGSGAPPLEYPWQGMLAATRMT